MSSWSSPHYTWYEALTPDSVIRTQWNIILHKHKLLSVNSKSVKLRHNSQTKNSQNLYLSLSSSWSSSSVNGSFYSLTIFLPLFPKAEIPSLVPGLILGQVVWEKGLPLHIHGAVYTGLQLSKPVRMSQARLLTGLISILLVSHLYIVGGMASLSRCNT